MLHRLAGLSKVISPAVMEQALLDTGRAGQRACTLSYRVMLWVVLAMACSPICPFVRSSNTRADAPGRQNSGEQSVRGATAPGGGAGPTGFDLVVKPLAMPQTPGPSITACA